MEKDSRSSAAEKVRAYRKRLVASGRQEVLFELPSETVAFLELLKTRGGLRNRSQALMQLIEKGREIEEQQTA